jgi:hypothetical protein
MEPAAATGHVLGGDAAADDSAGRPAASSQEKTVGPNKLARFRDCLVSKSEAKRKGMYTWYG